MVAQKMETKSQEIGEKCLTLVLLGWSIKEIFKKSEPPMKKLALLVVVVSLFVASPVMGGNDGRTLKHYCEVALLSVKNDFSSVHLLEDFNTCVSTVDTVFATISKFDRFVTLEQPNAFSCIPDKIELLEQIKIVYTYLKEHPDKLSTDAITLIMEAIAETFPCPESQPEK